MAHYKGAASEAGRAMHLIKKREKQQMEIEIRRKKIEEELKVTNIETKFATHNEDAGQGENTTFGLLTLDQMQAKHENEMKERQKKIAQKQLEKEREKQRQLEAKQAEKNKQKQQIQALSFSLDGEEEEDDEESSEADEIKEKESVKEECPIPVKKIKKNPDVDTSFLPDREREEEETRLREELRQEWAAKQSTLKEEEIDITFSYWDGSGHRKTVKMKKGNTIYQFLQRCLEILRKEFSELKIVTADQLMYVKEDLILPHHYSFYDFIVTKEKNFKFEDTIYREKESGKIQIILFSVFGTSFINGMSTAWSGPALKILTSYDSPIPIDKSEISWLAFATTVGDLTTILLCGIVFRNFGRKTLTVCCALFLVFSWLLNTLATSFGELLVSQFLINAAIGIHDVSYCVYVSEIASVKNRGVFIALFLLCYMFGIEAMYLVGILNNYIYLNMVPLLVSIVSLIFCFYAVESPYYLLTRNKADEAWKSLSYLNANEDFYRIAQEYDELRQIVNEESKEDDFKFLLSTENYKMYLSVTVVYLIVYTNGTFLFLSYGSIVLEEFADYLDYHFVMNLFGFMNIVSVVVSPFVIERFGRRFLILIGFLSVALMQLFIAVGFYANDFPDYHTSFLSWSVLIAAILDTIIFVVIIHPVSHVLKSEMLPIKLRNSGSCVMEVLKVITQGLVLSLFIPIYSVFGMGFNFFIYSFAAFYGAYFVYTHLKETRGKTLCEIKNDYAQF